MTTNESGAPASGTGSHASTEPQEGLGPSGFDPSREGKGYIVGQLDERRAVTRFLTVRASRALLHHNKLPWWQITDRLRSKFIAMANAMAAQEIEQGEHVLEQSVWLVDIEAGIVFARAAERRDRDGSPKGEDADAASFTTARAEGIAKSQPENPAIPTTPPEIAA